MADPVVNPMLQIQAAYEAQHPEVLAKRLEAEKAAAEKAAYDALPYETRLTQSRADQTAAREAASTWKPSSEQEAAWASAPPGIRQMALKLNNPNTAAADAQDIKTNQLIQGHIAEQLRQQAGGYGFNWDVNKDAAFHTGRVAMQLFNQGITDLNQLGYTEDKNYLLNKETGQPLKWYKQDNHDDPLQNKGQLGWEAGGVGRTNYMVRTDANGNPVIVPDWKSNAPTGLGGFLLKAAPVLTNFIPGMTGWGSALINAGLTGLQGGGLGDMLKSGALSALGNKIGNWGANAATANLPMIGTAGITNTIADAAGGALSGGVRSAIQGQDVLSGAATGAGGSLIGSGVSGLASLIPGNLTGNALVDKYGAQVAASMLKTYGKQGLNSLLGPSTGRTRVGATSAGTNAQTQAGSNSQQNGVAGLDLTNLLPLLALMGQNPATAPAQPQLYSGPVSNTDWLYSTPRQRPA